MEQTETKKTKWFFSLFSGEIYEVPLEEARLLDAHQLALKEKPLLSHLRLLHLIFLIQVISAAKNAMVNCM